MGTPPEGLGRTGSWSCRRRRRRCRAARARPAARGGRSRRPAARVWLSRAGAPGPPSDAAAASVGSASALGGRSVSFGLFLCSARSRVGAERGASGDACAPRRRLHREPGKRERASCLPLHLIRQLWDGGGAWEAELGAGRLRAGAPRDPREVVPGVAFLLSAGGVGHAAGSGERRCRWSPRMPPGAPVLGSAPHARAARAPGGGHVRVHAPQLRPQPAATPPVVPCQPPGGMQSSPLGSCPRAPPGRKGSSGGPNVGGPLCGLLRLGRLLWEGQRQDKAGWSGTTDSGGPRCSLGWGCGDGGGGGEGCKE